ncbi:MAG TPA: argininosuccinate lyase, partial [Calditrichia bacterium]|nr:argininosuccinate lyase [Calditrichia bacterium]
MPSLQVRDLPDHLYQKLKDMAAAEHRSISQQAIVMLEKGFAAD